jgi:hypothetical protein
MKAIIMVSSTDNLLQPHVLVDGPNAINHKKMFVLFPYPLAYLYP